ncbi:MAG: ion transporter [Kiritimatiellae bacterium]|nr:ion transporter [Kiritimatiellia bacterium]
MKKRVFDIIQIGKKGDIPSIAFDYALTGNIVLNILVLVLETFDGLSARARAFRAVEVATTLFFCVEYLLRLWTADLLHRARNPLVSRLRFVFSFDGLVALFSILPVFFFRGVVAFRMLRVVRILHLFRLNAKYDSFNVITSVMREKSRQILSSLFIIAVLMVAGSICMYNAEHAAQPEVFRNAFSGLWWSVSTTLTIGYGDIYPVTPAGTVLAIFLAFLGVGAVAIPTGIIGAGFVEKFTRAENAVKRFHDVSAIGEIRVAEGSELARKTIDDLRRSYGMTVYLVVRGDLSVLAESNLVVRPGDILIVKSDHLAKPSA